MYFELIIIDHCHPKMPKCVNGVCLDSLCYCNDGFGGKGCDLPGIQILYLSGSKLFKETYTYYKFTQLFYSSKVYIIIYLLYNYWCKLLFSANFRWKWM